MLFDIEKSIEILHKTPKVLEAILEGLSDEWLFNNEGEGTWCPYDIIGHLIHGEKTDWMVRAKIILSKSADKTFEPFDRFAQMKTDKSQDINELLLEFRELREQNLNELKSLPINKDTLSQTGIHPDLGEASLRELLSAWVIQDLGHIAQISRVMASQYKDEVGPWIKYLGILRK